MHLSIRITLALGAVAVGIPFSPAWPWGSDGHRTIGMVADLLLQSAPASRDAVSQILGGISYRSFGFADCAKAGGRANAHSQLMSRTMRKHNPQHRTFHYTDAAIQQRQYQLGTAGTRGDDVVQIAKQSVKILRNRASPKPRPGGSEQEASFMGAGYGRRHPPAAACRRAYFDKDCEELVTECGRSWLPDFGIGSMAISTHGGNDLKMPNGESFHVRDPDEGTVRGAMRLRDSKTITAFAQAIINRPPVGWETTGDPETWPEQWATESLPIAESALTDIEFSDATKTNSPMQKPKDPHGRVTIPRGREYAMGQ